jgi:UMF1 family MFS transporter
LNRRAINAWCLYDWANSAFATTVMAALYPPFFRSLATAAGLPAAMATAAWGYATAAGLLIVALLAPVLGAMADAMGARKRFLAIFAGLGILATLSFPCLREADWVHGALLYILANVGFAGSIVFYESLLPSLGRGSALDRISARGYALGYVGGGLLLALNALWVLHPGWFGMPEGRFAMKASFASVAVWWAVFALPLFRWVPEPALPMAQVENARGWQAVAAGWARLRDTLSELRLYRQLALFLAAYWLYSDGIGTIIKMATAYGDELGIGVGDMILALLLTQAVGIPCTLLFGRLAGRLGALRSIQLALAVYVVICVGGFLMRTALHFYILALMVGTVQGGAQALSRSLFATMVPPARTAQFYGFYSTSSKFAGIAGPLLFALVSQLTGHSRLSILALVVFFLAGGLLLGRVDVTAAQRAAGALEETESC